MEKREKQTSKRRKGLEEKIYQGKGGEWQLDIREKKRILLNNIYGVDIDRQAVNVTQLNLLLKALEGETDQTLQLSLFQERVLPRLGDNIKCGNSLIGPDFYATGQLTLFDDEETVRRHSELAGFPADNILELKTTIDPATPKGGA